MESDSDTLDMTLAVLVQQSKLRRGGVDARLTRDLVSIKYVPLINSCYCGEFSSTAGLDAYMFRRLNCLHSDLNIARYS